VTALELWNRFRDRIRRRQLDVELEDEMRFHREMLERDHRVNGATPEAAQRLGRMQLGNMTYLREETRALWSVRWADDLTRDVRFALRTLRKNPIFVIVALVCLTLGIGANGAIFSVIDGVLLRPLPYLHPKQLVRLFESQPQRGADWRGAVSWPNFRDWQAQSTAFSAMAAYVDGSSNLQSTVAPERLRTITATANYFKVYGVSPSVGRTFAAGEDEAGREHVVVLGEGLWRRRFAADPHVIDETIILDGQPFQVIGVMPAAFSATTDAWVPLVPAPLFAEERRSRFMTVIARRRSDISEAQAGAQMRDIAARLAQRYPADQTGRSVAVESMADLSTRAVRPALLILLGAVGLVLLIACANVANLLLARAAARQHEVSIRLALGAGRTRLIRQFLVESLMLSIVGTALGALLARTMLGPLVVLASGTLPFPGRIGLNGRVLLFLALVAIASGVAFGLAPALQLTRLAASTHLMGAGRKTAAGAQQRLRGALVVGEIALSVVLLIGAVLLIRGFTVLLDTSAGLDPDHVLTAHLAISPGRYDGTTLAPKLLDPVLERIRAIPGVKSAGLISMLPVQQAWANGDYYVPGDPTPDPGKEPIAEYRTSSADVYKSLGVPLLAGRDFTPADGTGERVVLINHALAREHFIGDSPIGRTIMIGGPSGMPFTIVGVIGDVRQAGLDKPPLAEIDVPYTDSLGVTGLTDAVLVLKTLVPPARVVPALREAVRSVDPGEPIYQVETMQEVLDASLVNRRLNLVLLAAFAMVALALSAAGLYGVISYLVTQRTQEIGIRIALGARGVDVVRLMVRQGVVLSGVGLLLGLAGAIALSRTLRSVLYGVTNTDPLTYALVTALLGAVAIAATWIPASRAARVSPLIAMKAD